MAQRRTPGVYITEKNTFPSSIVGVETAVPVFIGYTEDADRDEQAGRIASLAEFEARFGGRAPAGQPFLLADSLRLFWASGGKGCFVVSCGNYAAASVTLPALRAGLTTAGKLRDATLVIIPDAAALPDAASHATLTRETLQACRDGEDRVALIDPWSADGAALDAVLTAFRDGLAPVGEEARRYGAAYFPPLRWEAGGVTRTLPASAAVAGVIAATDRTRGVWAAPANVAVPGVPSVALDQAATDQLAHPADGLAVNAIRVFASVGPLVWGARTLDANSEDWRYLFIRRTMTFIEQSVRLAATAYVFEPNDANTWITIKSALQNFLFGLWKEGALSGATPDEAFNVMVGLGVTMTPDDILDGKLTVAVLVAVTDPGHFIEITFQQQMQRS